MIYSTTFKFVMAQRFLTTTLTILSFMSTVDKCVGVVFYLLSLLSFYVNKPYYLLSLKSFYIRLSYDFIFFLRSGRRHTVLGISAVRSPVCTSDRKLTLPVNFNLYKVYSICSYLVYVHVHCVKYFQMRSPLVT